MERKKLLRAPFGDIEIDRIALPFQLGGQKNGKEIGAENDALFLFLHPKQAFPGPWRAEMKSGPLQSRKIHRFPQLGEAALLTAGRAAGGGENQGEGRDPLQHGSGFGKTPLLHGGGKSPTVQLERTGGMAEGRLLMHALKLPRIQLFLREEGRLAVISG